MREEERGETEREAGEEVDVEITDINISPGPGPGEMCQVNTNPPDHHLTTGVTHQH